MNNSRVGAEDFLTGEQTRLIEQCHLDTPLALMPHKLKAT
jgi:hypothetical protein